MAYSSAPPDLRATSAASSMIEARINPSMTKSTQIRASLSCIPGEIIDIVLSYVIELPWHPCNAIYPVQAIKLLFPSNILHINRGLRQKAIDFITHGCLWIRIRTSSPRIRGHIQDLASVLPCVPPVYLEMLPNKLPDVKLVLHGREEEQARGEQSSSVRRYFTFPFNYQTFAAFIGVMMQLRWPVPPNEFDPVYSGEGHTRALASLGPLRSIQIFVSTLSPRIRTLVDTQVLSVLSLLQPRVKVKITTTRGSRIENAISCSNRTNKIDVLIALVVALDTAGRVLEASLLCLYCGFSVSHCEGQLSIAPFKSWTRSLSTTDWLQNPDNLNRMRHMRTLNYVECRALSVYLEGVHIYGMDFAKATFMHVSTLAITAPTVNRWRREPIFTWTGLSDHELASYHCMLSRIIRHDRELFTYLQDWAPSSPLLQKIKAPTRASVHAIVLLAALAWELDSDNLTYAGEVDSLAQAFPDEFDKFRAYSVFDIVRSHTYVDFDGSSQVLYPENYRSLTSNEWPYIRRARKLAEGADVVYLQRRLCGPETAVNDRVKRLLDATQVIEVLHGSDILQLGWEAVGLNTADVKAAAQARDPEGVAPWCSWELM